MKAKMIFVLGGAKSGKSSFALTHASGVKGKKAFIATAEALDGEMNERIKKHKAERGDEWDTYEEPVDVAKRLSGIRDKYSVVLIDCLTLWLSNVMISDQQSAVSGQRTDNRTQATEASITEFINTLKGLNESPACARGGSSVLYIVSNEVGTGIVPGNDLARKFRDLAGNLNQRIAGISDEVYLVVAGIPVKIK